MTANDFRSLALSLPEADEDQHMGHPDFRVRNKIFATLGPDESWGMVKLTPDQQSAFVKTESAVFQPIKGAWGKRGCTQVTLKPAKRTTVRIALEMAWRNSAPRKLAEEFEEHL